MIAEKTGWTDDYIMWRTSWVNIRMMLADASRMSKNKKPKLKIMQGSDLAKEMGLI